MQVSPPFLPAPGGAVSFSAPWFNPDWIPACAALTANAYTKAPTLIPTIRFESPTVIAFVTTGIWLQEGAAKWQI